ncbi:hypothetical protein psal_cds_1337 [Pandoravirus salinus]|uniref:Uncharacterized protein n=1 Tax=Pandoravirus salinus TaxID=1349410 RepID=S4VYE9_9VIRU|nr:hypothetical protein psal_cds_1337 [Pandoravirus salinus]AGO85724.1 hypothetical protein psal_cds_1337 [Pandoravirus salinus]
MNDNDTAQRVLDQHVICAKILLARAPEGDMHRSACLPLPPIAAASTTAAVVARQRAAAYMATINLDLILDIHDPSRRLP